MMNSKLRSPSKRPDINSWRLVIKVNFGDSLKRFGASVYQNSVDLNMMNLRAKIITLFKLTLSAKLALTYVDEDGDDVALDTDDELRDAIVIQRLNPLRINVQLLHSSNQESSLGTVFSKSTTTCMQLSEKKPCQFRSIVDDENSKWDKFNVFQGQGALSHVTEGLQLDGLVRKPAVSAAAKPHNSSTSKSLTASMGVASITTSIDKKEKGTTPNETILKPSDFDNDTCQHDTCKPYMQTIKRRHPSFPPPLHTAFSSSGCGCHSDLSLSKHLNPAVLERPFPRGSFPTRHPYKRTAIHIGVMCDGCEMYPIIGTRMKSKVKENYDLCSLCFLEIGCESDYTKIDSTGFASSSQLRKFYDSLSHSKHQLSGLDTLSWKKFDSCFIEDVTISDGMLVAPSTTFTKIWRMYNNGNSRWPYGTQLVWIGGDQFSGQDRILLDIPEEGYPAGQEIDIAIDFTSPSSAGSYVSHWRLALPSGHKFGHRVWFYIQVENSQPDCDKEKLPTDIDLNLRPESISEHELGLTVLLKDSCTDTRDESPRAAHPVMGDTVPEIMPCIHFVTAPIASLPAPLQNDLVYTVLPTEAVTGAGDAVEEGELPRDAHPATGDAENLPADINLNLQSESSSQDEFALSVFLEDSCFDTREELPRDTNPAMGDSAPEIMPSVSSVTVPVFEPVDTGLPTEAVSVEDDAAEQTLRKELEDMGFKQIDLNKEVPNLNDYNLEKSLTDLHYEEWDMLLTELQELGFYDEEKNKTLLIKNSGSIARVVKDLIAEENA